MPIAPPLSRHPALLSLALVACGAAPAAQAGPVLCTTTLEAPPVVAGAPPAAPVEVSRCGPVTTVPELLTRRYYGWTAPYARGIDLTHQITDLFGLAMGGGDGTRLMGLGFADQAITWDGSAIESTAAALLDDQSPVLPLRTADLSGVFSTSLGGSVPPDAAVRGVSSPVPAPYPLPVRGFW